MMTLRKTNVNESITLSSIYTDKFKSGMLTFSLYLPLTPKNYLYNLVLAGVCRRGSDKFPSMAAINRQLDSLYAASVDIQTTIQGETLVFTISAEIIEERFIPDGTDVSGGVIDVIADILLHPVRHSNAFPSDIVLSECGFVKDSLESEINNTRAYAATRLKEIMCRDTESFPTLKYLLGEIDSVTPDSLTAHYSHLISNAPMSVFYIGAEDVQSIAQKLERALRDFSGTRAFSFPALTPSKKTEFLFVSEDMPVNQGKLALGFRTGACLGNGDYHAAIMLNEIFGASPASKLFMNVREKMSLCYYCSSSYSLFSGGLYVSSGIESKNRERLTDAVRSQLDEIRKGNVSESELYAARKSLEYSYVQIYDSPFSLAAFYSGRELAGVEETVEDCKARILSVTPERICKIANATIHDTSFFVNGTLIGGREEDEDED
ncbi:MAG: insulinase family protein [Ruminococcaceae bacterium]|nr:insulinase family protein [Oscillospiraceae bacterium]